MHLRGEFEELGVDFEVSCSGASFVYFEAVALFDFFEVYDAEVIEAVFFAGYGENGQVIQLLIKVLLPEEIAIAVDEVEGGECVSCAFGGDEDDFDVDLVFGDAWHRLKGLVEVGIVGDTDSVGLLFGSVVIDEEEEAVEHSCLNGVFGAGFFEFGCEGMRQQAACCEAKHGEAQP